MNRIGSCTGAVRLTERYADIQAIKSYVDACPNLAAADVATERNTLAGVLSVPQLLKGANQLAIAEEAFRRLKEKHSHAYRKTHRDHHEQLGKLNSRLQPLARKLTAIARLNESGTRQPPGSRPSPTAPSTARRHGRLCREGPCQRRATADLPAVPLGRPSRLSHRGSRRPRGRHRGDHRQLTIRVSRGTVASCWRIIRTERQDTAADHLASQTDRLADVLTSEVVERIREILQDANLEPRDLPVQDLLGELTAVEEEDIESLVRQIEQRLRAAFKQAKAETEGKKRVRFFLK